MKRHIKGSALAAAGAAAVVGLGVFAAPAFAGNGYGPGDGTCPNRTAGTAQPGEPGAGGGLGMGYRWGANGNGGGQGARVGQGPGAGECQVCTAYPMGELTDAQKDTLAYMVQEEKLAYDLYTQFAEQYDAAKFERIARSESRHMTAVRTLLERYGLEDPTADAAVAEFADAELAGMYEDLLAQGTESYDEALAVGRAVETNDIEELQAALEGLEAEDVAHVYTMLRRASEHHLTAFGG